jgi:hypothetical protein
MDTVILVLLALGVPVGVVLLAWRWVFTSDDEGNDDA